MTDLQNLPKIGDKIIITDPDLKDFHEREWAITKMPLAGECFGPYDPEVVWITPESGPNWPNPNTNGVFLFPHQYELVGEK